MEYRVYKGTKVVEEISALLLTPFPDKVTSGRKKGTGLRGQVSVLQRIVTYPGCLNPKELCSSQDSCIKSNYF